MERESMQRRPRSAPNAEPHHRPDPLPPPERKADYVRDMFGRIASRYDLMNRLMSLGRDQAWRRYAVTQVLGTLESGGTGGDSPGRVLDVATGTGDFGLEVLRQQPSVRVVGLDFVPDMLVQAQRKAKHAATARTVREPSKVGGLTGRFQFVAGDALRLPFSDGSFDATVTAFALRNVTDIPAAFAEMARVTRPGGRTACLELAKPRLPLFRRLYSLYFYRLVPLIGTLITGQRLAYTYLPHSLTAFLTPDEIAQVMGQTDWRDVHYKRLQLGTAAVHVGVRE